MRNFFVGCFLSSMMLISCGFDGERVSGDGNITTQERTVSSFSKVEVHGSVDVYISQGPLAPVKIEGDANLIEFLEFVEQGDKLEVRTREGFNIHPTQDMKIYITAPLYKSIEVSGACDIIGATKIDNSEDLKLQVSGAGEIKMEVDAPKITVGISGSGSVNMKGQTKDFDLDLSGAGKARCYELLSENTSVQISGAGDAEVYASVTLKAQVSGAGNIKYKGEAKNINQQVSGAGSVNKR